jgi:hydrogenase maturation factor
MMEGTHVYRGRLVELRSGPSGVVGRVSVGGARVEVACDLVPGARVGDEVLVHAGVALSIVREWPAAGEAGRRGS